MFRAQSRALGSKAPLKATQVVRSWFILHGALGLKKAQLHSPKTQILSTPKSSDESEML